MARLVAHLFAILLLVVAVCPSAFALAGEYGPDKPIVQQPEWPEGLAGLLTSFDPVYVFWVNWQDNFYYSGDAEKFNAFMERYGKLEGIPHTLVLRCGRGEVKDLAKPKMHAFDWHVFVVPPMIPDGGRDASSPYKRYVTVNLYVGCNIQLSDIKVPANVKLVSGGGIEKFIKQHEAQPPKVETGSGHFGIYLLANEKLNGAEALKMKLDDIVLQEKPLLTLDDFICYSWKDHWFKLTPEALERLPKASPPQNRLLSGIPFVLVAGGQRIYLGAFWTTISSMSFPNPVILADSMFMPARLNWLTVDRAYPGATPEQLKDDIRNSPLVRDAFEAAGKFDACDGLARPPSGGFSLATPSVNPE